VRGVDGDRTPEQRQAEARVAAEDTRQVAEDLALRDQHVGIVRPELVGAVDGATEPPQAREALPAEAGELDLLPQIAGERHVGMRVASSAASAASLMARPCSSRAIRRARSPAGRRSTPSQRASAAAAPARDVAFALAPSTRHPITTAIATLVRTTRMPRALRSGGRNRQWDLRTIATMTPSAVTIAQSHTKTSPKRV
jgi:hypothetical protein